MRRHLSEEPVLLRLSLSVLIAVLVAFASWPLEGLTRTLLAWSCGALVYLMLALWLALRLKAGQVRNRALSLDPPNSWLLVIMLLAVAACVVVIVMLLEQGKSQPFWSRSAHVALGMVSLALSWLLIHTLYAFHYAHRYYQDLSRQPGLDFPDKRDPDYFDFLYYSFVLGMTSQVSDVQTNSSQMRRLTLIHGVVSFAFNVVVLSLCINTVASMF